MKGWHPVLAPEAPGVCLPPEAPDTPVIRPEAPGVSDAPVIRPEAPGDDSADECVFTGRVFKINKKTRKLILVKPRQATTSQVKGFNWKGPEGEPGGWLPLLPLPADDFFAS